jgi:hypothetical protein
VPRYFRAGRGELHRQLSATLAALGGNRRLATVNKQKARRDVRTWQVERRKRARHLIELGGLVVKAGIVDLTGDDRATTFSALLWAPAGSRAITGAKPARPVLGA